MKKILSVICIICLLISVFAVMSNATSTGTTYYVDSQNGDDNNSGTLSAPFKTAEKALTAVISAGDKILFKCDGKYECSQTLTDVSGTKENPIMISSYGTGDKPVLTTNRRADILDLIDCSFIEISNLEFIAHNGGGIWIDTRNKVSEGISVSDCDFHDIQNTKMNSRDNLSGNATSARACIIVKSLPARSRYAVNDFTVSGCEMYDCGNGISLWGSWNDAQNPWCDTEEEIDPVFNKGILVKDTYFHDMDAEAIIVGMCDGALVTNCRMIDCCQGDGLDENGNVKYYNAAAWFWGSVNSTIQYCEIAGQKNVGDGMTVDFDSYSHYCTYQYIYSHDNSRFMCNCPNYSGQHGNTVRYCLSVNDNLGRSRTASDSGEYNFSFYNNTIINCADFMITEIHDSIIKNNIIIPDDKSVVSYDLDALFKGNVFENNCYYNTMKPLVDLKSFAMKPGFDTNLSGIYAYELFSDSPLIGAGSKIDDGLTEDFFGNEITSDNIGCYGGTGENSGHQKESTLENALKRILMSFKMLIHEIKNLFK